jgi:Fe-S oxidoreductase
VTFKQWFRLRSRDREQAEGAPEVILWADTFNNYFHPRVAIAATEVLEGAGFRVLVPRAPLCCGRPLYDYGFLDQAQSLLQDILITLKPKIEAGVPMVALEPSCLAVFRDEMLELFPHDQDAKRLHNQAFTLAEFLTRHNYTPPRMERDLIVHGHCHQKSAIGLAAEKQLFDTMGARAEILDDGCCGMAGSFGFEPHKYEVSMKVYQHELGPHLSHTSTDDVVLADGFSCKTQIEQVTGRRPLHLAELLRGPSADSLAPLERASRSRRRKVAIAVSVVAAAFAAWKMLRRSTAPYSRR